LSFRCVRTLGIDMLRETWYVSIRCFCFMIRTYRQVKATTERGEDKNWIQILPA